MRQRFSYALIILFFSFIFIYPQSSNLIYDQLQRPDNAAYYHVPVGLCEDYPEETTTMQIIKNDFEFLKKHNIKLLRISFGWDAIETEKGKFEWLFWDDFVKMAVDDYGITLVPYVCYTPQWISRGASDTLFFWNYPPKDFSEFGVFMTHLVNRYKDRIKTWELWNEPDIEIYWQGSVKEFADFIKVGADAVKKADPSAKVVLGGLAYDPYFLLHLFRDNGLSPYIDIVNCHNYYETWHRHPIEDITEYINEISDIIWRYGNNQSLWMAEVGYSTFRKGARVSDSYSAYYNYEHTPGYQAVELFKTLTLAVSTEKLSAITWYELKDLPPSEGVIGDNDNNRFLGVAYPDWTDKPAAKSLEFFNSMFSSKYKSIDDEVTLITPIGSDSRAHAFQMENGDVVIAAWLQTSVPGRQGSDKSGMVEDKRIEKVDIVIPIELNGKVSQYNELGDESSFSNKMNEPGQTILNDLELKGGKIVILKIRK